MSAAGVLELVAASIGGAVELWPDASAADASDDESSDELDFASNDAEDSEEAVAAARYPSGNWRIGGVTVSFHTKVMPRSGCCHSFAVWYREQVSGWPSGPKVGTLRMQLFQTSLEDTGTPAASTGKSTAAAEDDEAADVASLLMLDDELDDTGPTGADEPAAAGMASQEKERAFVAGVASSIVKPSTDCAVMPQNVVGIPSGVTLTVGSVENTESKWTSTFDSPALTVAVPSCWWLRESRPSIDTSPRK